MEEPPPAPPSFFCRARRPSPRVFAAGAVAADSESLVENQKLPSLVQEPYYPESGWDRLRELFVRDEQQRISKELENIYRAAASAGIIGWAYGGIPAFIHAKQRYIEQSQAEIYHNRFDAVVKALIQECLLNLAVTGGLFRINLGIRGLVAGGIIGGLLGTPVGGLMMALQKYYGETVQERKQKDRKAFCELKQEEWKARLQLTELLPQEIENSLQKNQSEEDAKKIEILLNLPRNPSSPDKQDKD
ncbi:complex I assembly factor TIMMDC1, mitochondrial [Marmota marmota marmota]|uniref:complex I assembly factor TIMMDC1, mitochondrial n=1 Tax=Marmota marmota marmota TaxID=9994 RepID=UPI002093C050|nr:complex I assembly factor TIMMDC1, mitochondrial [Marmota marmota marmota]